jgi:hypothetical protein
MHINDDSKGKLGDLPTLEVEVPIMPPRSPQPSPGYGYHARALDETDIDSIPEEKWEIVCVAPRPEDVFLYRGQRQLHSTTVNVWYCGDEEGFFAQALQGC